VEKMKIGIIGQGFVGSAIYFGLKNYYDVITYDIKEELCSHTHEDICQLSNIIFVCVPTPMRSSGQCDISILLNVLLRLDYMLSKRLDRVTVVIKSTIPPGTTDDLQRRCQSMDLCFSPEFLTEANSMADFKNQSRIIIGGNGAKKVKQMFRKAFPEIPIILTKSETAEMVKYFTNCFLATKVTFANELYDICHSAGIDYDKVCEYALYDERIGKSHLAVPGPDGDRGFGGHCFPKDLEALIYFSEQADHEPSLLKRVLDNNDKIRKNRDWEKMKGRAVSDE
jgi:UDPglucose 6-dehydrogenase